MLRSRPGWKQKKARRVSDVQTSRPQSTNGHLGWIPFCDAGSTPRALTQLNRGGGSNETSSSTAHTRSRHQQPVRYSRTSSRTRDERGPRRTPGSACQHPAIAALSNKVEEGLMQISVQLRGNAFSTLAPLRAPRWDNYDGLSNEKRKLVSVDPRH